MSALESKMILQYVGTKTVAECHTRVILLLYTCGELPQKLSAAMYTGNVPAPWGSALVPFLCHTLLVSPSQHTFSTIQDRSASKQRWVESPLKALQERTSEWSSARLGHHVIVIQIFTRHLCNIDFQANVWFLISTATCTVVIKISSTEPDNCVTHR